VKPGQTVALGVLAAVLICIPWAARAQSDGYLSSPVKYRLQYYLGASLGAALYPDQSGATAGGLDSMYTAMTPLGPGDFIASAVAQDQGALGAKIYGGAWITPNVAVEAGWVSLGSIGWSGFSANTTGSFATGSSGSVVPHAWYESVLVGFDSYGLRFFAKGGLYEASTNLQASSFNFNTGAGYGPSQTVRNTNGLVGLGIHTSYGQTAMRLEIEDFINVGASSSPEPLIPPWRGSVLLITAGVAYLF